MSLIKQTELWGSHIPWLEGLREKARTAFLKQGLPTSKTEAWKYSFFKESDLDSPQPDMIEHQCSGHCHRQESAPLDAIQISYCNGKLHSEEFPHIQGLIIKPLVEAIYDGDVRQYVNKSFDMEKLPFAALNTAYLEQGIFVLAERGMDLKRPIYICYHNHNDHNRLENIRNIIVCERAAKIKIIEHFTAENDARYFQNVVNEVYLSADSQVKHITIQTESSLAHRVALNSVCMKENGKYEAFCMQKGARLSRQESQIQLLQEGAEAKVNGIYTLLAAKQLCDTTTNIRHLAPHTYSDQLVKGVAQKSGVGVFQGQIHISKDAQQCEGYQLHRALLLDDGAEIDCKPELEIYADDVKCSHGAASGDLDMEQMFYLQSRGMSAEEACKILIEAYLNEVIQTISDEDLRAWVKQNI